MTHMRRGFSLMEMVIVLAIMAVFAVLVGPPMFKYLSGAKVETTKSNLKVIKQAIDSYNVDTGMYPTSLRDLSRRPLEEAAAKDWAGPYIEAKDIPKDGWKHDFVYKVNPAGSETPYELYSEGKPGESSPITA